MAADLRKDDFGTVFTLTVKDEAGNTVDVSSASGATDKQVIFKKPSDGEILTKNASFVTDGTNGQVSYTTVSGDIDEAGHWEMQAKVVLTSGTFKSDTADFFVGANLE
jgi:hypothetical protein